MYDALLISSRQDCTDDCHNGPKFARRARDESHNSDCSSRSSPATGTYNNIPHEMTNNGSIQWKEEIDQKTNGLFEVHIHHGRDKLKTLQKLHSKDVIYILTVKVLTLQQPSPFQIIITTYQTLTNDFTPPPTIEPEEVYEWVIEHGSVLRALFRGITSRLRIRGPLARMKWYRVILDEAQFIRNRYNLCFIHSNLT